MPATAVVRIQSLLVYFGGYDCLCLTLQGLPHLPIQLAWCQACAIRPSLRSALEGLVYTLHIAAKHLLENGLYLSMLLMHLHRHLLLQADIPCSYAFLSGLSYCMREVTKVMLGAAAVLSNGTVLSRAGSAAVAMSAAASSKPVLVCCEAFKFHERVQLDSITHNELGDPDVLAHLPPHAAAPGTPTGQVHRESFTTASVVQFDLLLPLCRVMHPSVVVPCTHSYWGLIRQL